MSIETREQCPSCKDTGADNLIVYTNGSKHCHACGYHEGDTVTVGAGLVNVSYRDIPNRCLSKKVCQFFGYGAGKYKDKACHVANYCDDSGKAVAQKIRTKGKHFTIVGEAKKMRLFGQHLYNPNDKVFVTVTEGEIDALSVAEVQGTQFPVVSIANGANNARKELTAQLEWLSGFKHVVLLFDQDDAGRKAVQECVEIFEPGKVKVAKVPLKDANDMLKAGRGSELRSALFNAQAVMPDSLLFAKDIADMSMELPSMGMSWGFSELDRLTYGVQNGGVYTIGAGSGVGKTTFVRDVVVNSIVNEGKRVVLCAFEQPLRDVKLRAAGYVLNVPAHIPGVLKDMGKVNEVWKNKLGDKLAVHNNEEGIPGCDSIYSKLRCYAKICEADLLVVDNLSQVVRGDKDERLRIDKIMFELQRLAVELDIPIIVVSHLSQPDKGLSWADGRKVRPSDLRGSSSIESNSYMVLGLERNKLDEHGEEKNQLTVRILKDRFTGESDGKVVYLSYDQETGKLNEQGEVI